MHFTLKTNPIKYEDLHDFVECYNPANRHDRTETERFKSYTFNELMQRDKVSLDMFWLNDASLEDADNLPDPDTLAREIADNLDSALEQFSSLSEDLVDEQENIISN